MHNWAKKRPQIPGHARPQRGCGQDPQRWGLGAIGHEWPALEVRGHPGQKDINKLSDRTKQITSTLPMPPEVLEISRSKEDVIFYGAPLLILISVNKSEDPIRSMNILDCGLAAQNMFLKAYEEGLGSCFIGFADFLNMDPSILEEVGISKDLELIAPLIFGYPAESPEAPSRDVKVIKWIK
jgi:hypothetical protein